MTDKELAIVHCMRLAGRSRQCHHSDDLVKFIDNVVIHKKLHFVSSRGKDYKDIINILKDNNISYEIIEKPWVSADNTHYVRFNSTIHITEEI